mmetsp:Transcript_16773/g.20493  ORF Transcript_16773/g.20493 Transcript_16773/m.20493 type:complete len:83 (+) Transcript_16773:109-357(+)
MANSTSQNWCSSVTKSLSPSNKIKMKRVRDGVQNANVQNLSALSYIVFVSQRYVTYNLFNSSPTDIRFKHIIYSMLQMEFLS